MPFDVGAITARMMVDISDARASVNEAIRLLDSINRKSSSLRVDIPTQGIDQAATSLQRATKQADQYKKATDQATWSTNDLNAALRRMNDGSSKALQRQYEFLKAIGNQTKEVTRSLSTMTAIQGQVSGRLSGKSVVDSASVFAFAGSEASLREEIQQLKLMQKTVAEGSFDWITLNQRINQTQVSLDRFNLEYDRYVKKQRESSMMAKTQAMDSILNRSIFGRLSNYSAAESARGFSVTGGEAELREQIHQMELLQKTTVEGSFDWITLKQRINETKIALNRFNLEYTQYVRAQAQSASQAKSAQMGAILGRTFYSNLANYSAAESANTFGSKYIGQGENDLQEKYRELKLLQGTVARGSYDWHRYGEMIAQTETELNRFNSTGKMTAQDLYNLSVASFRVGLGLTAVGASVTGLTTHFARVAMNASETKNLYEVSMQGMRASTDQWIESLHASVGMSRTDLRQMVGTFKVMLEGMEVGSKDATKMSQSLTKLAYDISSLRNIGVEEAFVKISAALSGEIEPMRRLGILINEETVKNYAYAKGIAAVGQEMTQAEKVMARFGVLMEKTKFDQGDMERTLGSLANQVRIMKSEWQSLSETWGQIYEPAAKGVIGSVRELIRGTEDFIEANAAGVGAISLTTSALGLLASAAGPALIGISQLVMAVKLMQAPKLEKAIGRIGIYATAIIAAQTGINYLLAKINKSLDDQEQAWAEADEAAKQASDSFKDSQKEVLMQAIKTDRASFATQKWKSSVDELAKSYEKLGLKMEPGKLKAPGKETIQNLQIQYDSDLKKAESDYRTKYALYMKARAAAQKGSQSLPDQVTSAFYDNPYLSINQAAKSQAQLNAEEKKAYDVMMKAAQAYGVARNAAKGLAPAVKEAAEALRQANLAAAEQSRSNISKLIDGTYKERITKIRETWTDLKRAFDAGLINKRDFEEGQLQLGKMQEELGLLSLRWIGVSKSQYAHLKQSRKSKEEQDKWSESIRTTVDVMKDLADAGKAALQHGNDPLALKQITERIIELTRELRAGKSALVQWNEALHQAREEAIANSMEGVLASRAGMTPIEAMKMEIEDLQAYLPYIQQYPRLVEEINERMDENRYLRGEWVSDNFILKRVGVETADEYAKKLADLNEALSRTVKDSREWYEVSKQIKDLKLEESLSAQERALEEYGVTSERVTRIKLEEMRGILAGLTPGSNDFRNLSEQIGQIEEDLREIPNTEFLMLQYEEQTNRGFARRLQILNKILAASRDDLLIQKQVRDEIKQMNYEMNAARAEQEGAWGGFFIGMKDGFEQLADEANDFYKKGHEMAQKINSEFDSAIESIIDGSKSMSEAMSDAFREIAKEFAKMIAHMISNWILFGSIKGYGGDPTAGLLGNLGLIPSMAGAGMLGSKYSGTLGGAWWGIKNAPGRMVDSFGGPEIIEPDLSVADLGMRDTEAFQDRMKTAVDEVNIAFDEMGFKSTETATTISDEFGRAAQSGITSFSDLGLNFDGILGRMGSGVGQFASWIGSAFSGAGSGIGGWLGGLFGGGGAEASAAVPAMAKGTDYVPYTGLYQLHQGEMVVPEGPAEEARSGRGGSGRVIVLNIQNMITPEAVAQAMSQQEGREVIVNVINMDSLQNGRTRRTIRQE